MTTTSPKTSESTEDLAQTADHAGEAVAIEQIKQQVRMRRILSAKDLAARVQVAPDGSPVILRFSRTQRLEHQLLMISFSLLAVTGLLQRYSEWLPIQVTINTVLGGIDTARVLHHLAAILFIALSIYHVSAVLDSILVKGQVGSMWPRWRDAQDLIQMMAYNLSLTETKPACDRFSAEEKLEYWALIWGSVVMILTGAALWFPAAATRLLPGAAIPISRAVHSWEAVLATLAILTWHTYHVVIKERNTSIFTGTMTEEEMQESHPLEYRRILAAREYLQRMEGRDNGVDSHRPPATSAYPHP